MKAIIFDFDDTLYNGTVWNNWPKYMHKFLAKLFGGQERANQFITKYHFDTLPFIGQSVASALIKELGSAESFVKYQSDNVYPLEAPNLRFIDSDFLKDLKKDYHLYILSNSPVRYVRQHLAEGNIDENIFDGIFTNSFEVEDISKYPQYQHILKLENVSPNQIIVVGDNYTNDIVPALKLGLNGYHAPTLEKVYNLRNVINDIEDDSQQLKA